MRDNIFLLLATVLWGIWGFALKLAVDRAHPFTVQWMYALPNIVFIPVWYWLAHNASSAAASVGTGSSAANAIDLPALGWAGLAAVCSVGALLLMFFALQSKPATVAVAMTSAYPIITLALALVTHTEIFNLKHLAGIILIIAGVIVLQL